MKPSSSNFKKGLVSILATCILLPAALFGISSAFGNSLSAQELNTIADGVRRAAVQCYALEGFYPQTLDYLQSKYGVTTNENKYFIDYQYIAANLLPDITVLPISN